MTHRAGCGLESGMVKLAAQGLALEKQPKTQWPD